MKDIELECMPDWRYCLVATGTKVPFPARWQSNPLTLANITSGNVGLILGEASAGTCAIDFDGVSAWDWYEENIGGNIPKTITWSSGKEGRCQMAFQVPAQYWSYLKTRKIQLAAIADSTKFEGFEFRWTGGQSVLPPSIHPDSKTPYFWLHAPATTELAVIPDAILAYWLLMCNPEPKPHADVEYPKAAPEEINNIVQELKRVKPRMGWDQWAITTWIVTRAVGASDGLAIMKYYWPEQTPGEYDNLLKGNTPQHPATMGTIVKWIREAGGTVPKQHDIMLTGTAGAKLFAQSNRQYKKYF